LLPQFFDDGHKERHVRRIINVDPYLSYGSYPASGGLEITSFRPAFVSVNGIDHFVTPPRGSGAEIHQSFAAGVDSHCSDYCPFQRVGVEKHMLSGGS
jgi:hypothetical protein